MNRTVRSVSFIAVTSKLRTMRADTSSIEDGEGLTDEKTPIASSSNGKDLHMRRRSNLASIMMDFLDFIIKNDMAKVSLIQ